jgi:hypothetical protein
MVHTCGVDIGVLLRIRNSAQEALTATPPDHSSAWNGLVETYERLREWAAQVIGDAHRDEFNRLFPQTIDQRIAGTGAAGGRPNPAALFAQQEVASEARTRLGSLAGWLNGFIEEAQFRTRVQAESDAYAKERVKAERGVGFKPPEQSG